MRKTVLGAVVFLLIAAGSALPAGAAPVATAHPGPTGIEWQARHPAMGLVLTVAGPDGFYLRQELAPGEAAAFSLFDEAGGLRPAGSYVYELRAVPQIDDATRAELDAARESGSDSSLAKAANAPAAQVQSGAFSIVDGALVAGGDAEPGARDLPVREGPVLAKKDIVHADDVIINGGSASLCVGFDCVNGENFGFDTIRTKENNTRIQFDDTSTTSGFATNNWQIRANSSVSGGQSFLAFVDQGATGTSESGTILFQVTAGAPANSVVVDSTGRVGFRTATPVLDLHVSTTNTPAMRLEQTSAGGFTAQTWDIAGNEANFFVRDVTSGSRLPFRIRPGAPTSSIDISASGSVGMGTTAPEGNLEVESSGDTDFRITRSTAGVTDTQFRTTVTANNAFFGTSTNDVMAFTVNAVERMRINTTGNVALGCQNPGSDLVVGSATDCSTAPASSMNAGDSSFTVTSSRTLKENLTPVQVPGILERIGAIGVYQYDFIDGPEDRIGLMAEDFHRIFGRGSDKLLNGQEVQMALWIAVQELASENRKLKDDVGEKDQALSALQDRLERVEAALAVAD